MGETARSLFFLGGRPVRLKVGSMFSLRLGVTGRVGDRRLGEANREGELLLVGDVLLFVESVP